MHLALSQVWKGGHQALGTTLPRFSHLSQKPWSYLSRYRDGVPSLVLCCFSLPGLVPASCQRRKDIPPFLRFGEEEQQGQAGLMLKPHWPQGGSRTKAEQGCLWACCCSLTSVTFGWPGQDKAQQSQKWACYPSSLSFHPCSQKPQCLHNGREMGMLQGKTANKQKSLTEKHDFKDSPILL